MRAGGAGRAGVPIVGGPADMTLTMGEGEEEDGPVAAEGELA